MTMLHRESHLGSEFDHERLASEAACALRERRFADAFALADRRCRILPVAEAEHYLLRAAALNGLGEAERASRDVRQAIEIDPENAVANRALLGSPSREERESAARILLSREKRPAVVKEAIAALDAAGIAVFGAFDAGLKGVRGWLAWREIDPLILRLEWTGGSRIAQVAPDPTHPLAEPGWSAARWGFDWPPGADGLDILPFPQPALLCDPHLVRPRRKPNPQQRTPVVERRDAGSQRVTVVLPIYGDYEATRTCLDTLLAEAPSTVARTVVAVDDASPDPRIRAMLDAAAKAGFLRLLRHERNHGFARSVNHALETAGGEDVLLLNADTVVPPGFLDRLAQAARARNDIGTVTPFSNNGEYTSFPIPFRENALPDTEKIGAIDRAAVRANTGRIVEMPNGTGFCLYITRACLDRIGPLSEAFGRGYGEDIEFCLRAAMAGFRNVCATDVFVGHAGTRSFGPKKRALVVHNLGRIAARFPGYRATSAAFMAADPLRGARAAIERALSIRELEPLHSWLAHGDEGPRFRLTGT